MLSKGPNLLDVFAYGRHLSVLETKEFLTFWVFMGFNHEFSLYFVDLAFVFWVWFSGGLFFPNSFSGVSLCIEGVGGGLWVEPSDGLSTFWV